MLKDCLAVLRAAGGGISLRRAIRGAVPVVGMASLLVLGGMEDVLAKEKGTIPVQLIAAAPGVLKTLAFDDPVSVIPAAAIDRLIMSGQVMGSRLRLKSGVEIYFPDGFVVLAEWQTADRGDISRIQDVAATRFGQECAGQSAGIRHYQLHRHPAGNVVLIEMMGNQLNPDALRITEVRDTDFLPKSAIVTDLKKRCGF